MFFSIFFVRKLALTCSILGLILLIVFNNFFQIPLTNLRDLSEDSVGSVVLVEGVVVDKKIIFSGHLVFELVNNGSKMRVIVFNPSSVLLDLIQNNEKIKFFARVSKYRGELELVFKKIQSD